MGLGQAGKKDRASNMPVYPKHTKWPETVSGMLLAYYSDFYNSGSTRSCGPVTNDTNRYLPLQPLTIYHNSQLDLGMARSRS